MEMQEIITKGHDMNPDKIEDYENKPILEIFKELTQIPPGGSEYLQTSMQAKTAFILYRIFKEYTEQNNKLTKRIIWLNTLLVFATIVYAIAVVLQYLAQ